MATIIQSRRDTSSNWTFVNPILAEGEIGLETDTNKFKFGNGIDNWIDIPYFGGETDPVQNLTGTEISFTNSIGAIYNKELPLDGNLNLNSTNAKIGSVAVVYHTGVDFGISSGNVIYQSGFISENKKTAVAIMYLGDNSYHLNVMSGKYNIDGLFSLSIISLDVERVSVGRLNEVLITGVAFSETMLLETDNGVATFEFISSSEIKLKITPAVLGVITFTLTKGDESVSNTSLESVETMAFDDLEFDLGYSLKRLNNNTVYPIKIRRSSDGALANVKFDGNEVSLNSTLDIGGTLGSFISSGNATVAVWYSQGTLKNDLINSDPDSQPILIESGQIVTMSSRKMLKFNSKILTSTSADSWMQSNYSCYVKFRLNTLNNGHLISSFGATAATRIFQIRPNSTSHIWNVCMSSDGATATVAEKSGLTVGENVNTFAYTGNNVAVALNGTLGIPLASPPTYSRTEKITLGSDIISQATSKLDGFIDTVLFWKSNQSANKTTIENKMNSL